MSAVSAATTSSSPLLTHSLVPFAPERRGPVRVLTVRVERTHQTLDLQYTLEGNLSRIRIPSRRPAVAMNELWKHTCFEAFIVPSPGADTHDAAYRELNFSPSSEWAAYSFDRYREGMAPIAMTSPPDIRTEHTVNELRVNVRVDLAPLVDTTRNIRLALSAVIEDDTGAISYWALKHAPDRPDFHHPAGFILEVGP